MVARNPYSFFKKAICYKLSFTPPHRGVSQVKDVCLLSSMTENMLMTLKLKQDPLTYTSTVKK